MGETLGPSGEARKAARLSVLGRGKPVPLRKAVFRQDDATKPDTGREKMMDNQYPSAKERLNTELKRAMYARDYDKTRLLIDRGANPNTQNGWGSPFIYWCSENGRIDLIDLALEKGGDINAVNRNGETALHKIAQLGRWKMVDPLIDRGADINYKNMYDATPLFFAVLRNYPEVVKKLLARGADPNIANHKGLTPAQKAEEKGNHEIIALLKPNSSHESPDCAVKRRLAGRQDPNPAPSVPAT